MTDIPEDVMKAARAAFVSCGFALSGDMRVRCEIVAARAILADRKRRVVVKGLEWWVSDTGDIIADSIVGRYRLGKVTANTRFRLETPAGLLTRLDYWEEAEAKAAAQADYERRILATLEFTDEPDPRLAAAEADAERLAEAAEICAIWLRSALDCKEWHWDFDQREAAEGTVAETKAALAAHEARKGERNE